MAIKARIDSIYFYRCHLALIQDARPNKLLSQISDVYFNFLNFDCMPFTLLQIIYDFLYLLMILDFFIRIFIFDPDHCREFNESKTL